MRTLTHRLVRSATVLGVFALAAGTLHGESITGPNLVDKTGNLQNSGLEITALQDTFLTGFTFVNQGAADTVELTNSTLTVVYDSITTPAGNGDYAATVTWSLAAGTTYLLVNDVSNNSYFAPYSSYPTSDDDISVVSGYFGPSGSGVAGSNWGGFNNLTTTAPSLVPEPSSLALSVIAGAFGLLIVRSRSGRR